MMKFILFVVALGAACIWALTWVFRDELKEARDARREALDAREVREAVDAVEPEEARERERIAAMAADHLAAMTAASAVPDPRKAARKPRAKREKAEPKPARVRGMVAGVTEDGRQRLIKKRCSEGGHLTLEREPKNRYDRNAVAIYAGGSQIGYVPRDDARAVAKYLDAGGSARASVVKVYGGTWDKPTLGVCFQIEMP